MATKKKTTTNQVTSNAPPAWAASGLATVGNRVGEAAANPVPQYTGDFVAAVNPLEHQAVQGMLDTSELAKSYSQRLDSLTGSAAAVPQFALGNSSFTDPTFASYDSTAIQPVISAALHPVVQNLMENILPGIADSATASGAYGNSLARETLPSVALRNFGDTAGRIATETAYKDFSDWRSLLPQFLQQDTQRGLGVAQQANDNRTLDANLLDQAIRMQSGGSDALTAASAAQRVLDQNPIDNSWQKHQYAVNAPYEGLDIASALLGQVANPWGTTTSKGTTTETTGGLGQVVQGLAGLGMAGASLASGGGAGGLLGGLGKVFSGGGLTGALKAAGASSVVTGR